MEKKNNNNVRVFGIHMHVGLSVALGLAFLILPLLLRHVFDLWWNHEKYKSEAECIQKAHEINSNGFLAVLNCKTGLMLDGPCYHIGCIGEFVFPYWFLSIIGLYALIVVPLVFWYKGISHKKTLLLKIGTFIFIVIFGFFLLISIVMIQRLMEEIYYYMMP